MSVRPPVVPVLPVLPVLLVLLVLRLCLFCRTPLSAGAFDRALTVCRLPSAVRRSVSVRTAGCLPAPGVRR
ncbi:hypothetical protein ACIBCM_22865 [Streptomyces sp. NPDC051018]|uniref:hypothetical protein n=1 Tax=Streptomyces sp. NPDC051018 TaxID=3365639 RepID=UPI0037879AEE